MVTKTRIKDDEGFTGHVDDAATGLTYMQARYYDPVIGCFLSNDPVGFAQGGTGYFNRYAYTMNNPINATDPDGRKVEFVGTKAEREKIRTVVLAVAKSDPKLTARFNELVKSEHTHRVEYTNNTVSTAGLVNSDNAKNGEGTSTVVKISRSIGPGDSYSDGSPRTEATVVAHELLSHSYDADKGMLSDDVNPKSKVKVREERGVKTENIFREAVGLEERTEYGGKKVDLDE